MIGRVEIEILGCQKENVSLSCLLGNMRISDKKLSNGYNVVENCYQHIFAIRFLYIVNQERFVLYDVSKRYFRNNTLDALRSSFSIQ